MKTLRTLALTTLMLVTSVTIAACGGGGDSTTSPTPNPDPGPKPVSSVQLSSAATTLEVGGTVTLAATTRDAQNNVLTGRAITWSSNAPQTATVSATGTVVAVAAGVARVTATSEGKSAEAVITVNAPAAVVASIEIGGALDTLEAYDVRTLVALVKDANNQGIPGAAITWTSSNPAVATIGANDGVLTGIDRGTVTITAQAGSKTHTVSRVVVIKYRSLALGTQHACDLASGGIAWCWGLNGTDARLGDDVVGDGLYRSSPVRVPGGHRFAQLVTFARFTCGLRLDGKAYCWGNNGWGALGAGSGVGYSATPLAVAGNITFAKLSAGADHACGITFANTTYCWGHNDWGQFGIGTTASPTAPLLAPTGLALKAIQAGPAFSCGIAMNGAGYCWGASGLGQMGDGTQISYGNTFRTVPTPIAGNHSFIALTLGYQFACGLTTTGSAYCWGSNGSRLGNGGTADASAPVAVAGGHTFLQIASGFGHSCAVTLAHDVYCWGSNSSGQVGAGGASSQSPVLSAGGMKMAEVGVAGIGTGSGSFTCAVSENRLTTYCWGRNEFGQLGNGTNSLPTAANPLPTIVVGQKPL
ncbi:MAG: Ig-like domain-containing protein [Gemmatimonadaceae bacterium]|nr:Ig-like domain-containing protein [Gemmatimonadaceae bacterium]